jgi:hypothetical protein
VEERSDKLRSSGEWRDLDTDARQEKRKMKATKEAKSGSNDAAIGEEELECTMCKTERVLGW